MANRKKYTVSALPDKNCPGGKMFNVYGPAITDALKKGMITKNETFDCDEIKLLRRLQSKKIIG